MRRSDGVLKGGDGTSKLAGKLKIGNVVLWSTVKWNEAKRIDDIGWDVCISLIYIYVTVCRFCAVRYLIIICFYLLFSNYSTYVLLYSFHLFFVLYFFLFCVFCDFILFLCCFVYYMSFCAVSFLFFCTSLSYHISLSYIKSNHIIYHITVLTHVDVVVHFIIFTCWIIQFTAHDKEVTVRHGSPTFYGKWLKPLFRSGSRATSKKIISDIHTCLNFCVKPMIHTHFKNVVAGHIIRPCGSRFGDSCCNELQPKHTVGCF